MPEEQAEKCKRCREVRDGFYRCPRGASFDSIILAGEWPECPGGEQGRLFE